MKNNFWGYLFAGVSAVAGIAYLFSAHNGAQNPVTNVFPPLNTQDPALPESTTADPSQVYQQPMVTSPVTQKQTRPTYPVYYT